LYQVRVITVFTVFRLLTDFVCLYNYEFGLSCLTPLSTILHLYHGCQSYWWRKPSTRRKTPTCRKSLTNFITKCCIKIKVSDICSYNMLVLSMLFSILNLYASSKAICIHRYSRTGQPHPLFSKLQNLNCIVSFSYYFQFNYT
jgi:hypothetical protein